MLIVYGMPKAHGRYACIGTYRFLTGNDAVSYRDHLTRLDINSRCARFSGAMTDAAIVGYVGRVAWERIDMMGYFVDGILRGVAEVHYDRSSAPVKAEIALSIENDFQNRRVGSKLMSIIVVILHEKSINNADVIYDTENKRMYYLAQKHGA